VDKKANGKRRFLAITMGNEFIKKNNPLSNE